MPGVVAKMRTRPRARMLARTPMRQLRMPACLTCLARRTQPTLRTRLPMPVGPTLQPILPATPAFQSPAQTSTGRASAERSATVVATPSIVEKPAHDTGWMCRNNVCTGPTAVCTSLLCVHSSDESEYCGDVGDGCGGTLSCPFVCPKVGWVCQDNMCVGRPDVCTPRTCANGFFDYCGDVGDGCGGTLHCSTTCPKTGWVCDNNICVGPPDVCSKLTCQFPGADICLFPPQVGHYCGTSVMDAAARSIADDCPPGWTCEEQHLPGLGGSVLACPM
jgi:hypothetical protein